MRKKRTALVMCMVMVGAVSLAGCGNTGTGSNNTIIDTEVEDVFQPVDNDSAIEDLDLTPDVIYSSEDAGDEEDTEEAVSEDMVSEDTEATDSSSAQGGDYYYNEELGIGFSLGTDWAFQESSNSAVDMQVVNNSTAETANVSLQIDVSVYDQLTESELIDAMLADGDYMSDVLAAQGMEWTGAEKTTVTFLGETCYAILVTGNYQGMPYYMTQVLKCEDESSIVMVTVTSFNSNTTQSILDMFYVVE